MNVVFLNTLYLPSREQLRKLEEMQQLIHFTRIQYLKEISKDPPYMQAARLANLPKMYRSRWEVFTNENYTALREQS